MMVFKDQHPQYRPLSDTPSTRARKLYKTLLFEGDIFKYYDFIYNSTRIRAFTFKAIAKDRKRLNGNGTRICFSRSLYMLFVFMRCCTNRPILNNILQNCILYLVIVLGN